MKREPSSYHQYVVVDEMTMRAVILVSKGNAMK